MTSLVNAPASLNSSLVSTQYILCGQGREDGWGRGIVVLKMYSRPVGGGKSCTREAGDGCCKINKNRTVKHNSPANNYKEKGRSSEL